MAGAVVRRVVKMTLPGEPGRDRRLTPVGREVPGATTDGFRPTSALTVEVNEMSLLEPDPEERPDPAFWENTYHNPPRGRRPRRPRRPSFPGTPGRRDHGRGHGLLIDPDDEPGLLGPDDYGSGLLDGGDYRPEPGPP